MLLLPELPICSWTTRSLRPTQGLLVLLHLHPQQETEKIHSAAKRKQSYQRWAWVYPGAPYTSQAQSNIWAMHSCGPRPPNSPI